MAQDLGAYTVEVHDPRDDSDDQIAESVALGNELQAEVLPDETPVRVEDGIALHRATPERVRRWHVDARDDSGRLVGIARTNLDAEHDDDPDVLWTGLGVLPEHRRRGVGRRLLGAIVDVAEELGRTRVIGNTNALRPASAAFAAATGAEAKSHWHSNRLLVADVDRAQLEGWVAEAATRSAGYEVIGWDGPVADDDLERWIDLVLVMNTAPRDDLDVNDFTLTPEEVRDQDRMIASIKAVTWTLVARRIDDGAWAGFHDVNWLPSDPRIVWVDSTGVRPEHRGHALGKWLKAAMTLRILDERPDVTDIRTGNADSNDAMLGINHAMGYRPWYATTTWELDVATARRFADGTSA